MSEIKSSQVSPEDKLVALLRILKATATFPAQITLYAAALGAIALIPGTQLPPSLLAIAGGVGVNVLSSILERIALGESVADEEILKEINNAINESRLAENLNSRSTQVMVARLFRRTDLLKFAIKNNELVLLERLAEQSVKYEALIDELRYDISMVHDLAQKGSAQTEEMLLLLNRINSTIHKPPLFLAPVRPPYNLVGREELFDELKGQLVKQDDTLTFSLHGLPGVGKTALAIELANNPEILKHFSDGVLWASVGRDGDPFTLLGSWGAALGIPSDEMMKLSSIEKRSDIIHSTIGTRRMLLVADDVWQLEGALAFKVGGPNCIHLLTTRFPEIAVHFAGDKAIHVHELKETQGITLLSNLAPKVVGNEAEEAKKLVKEVGGLPLALVIMGNYLRSQSNTGQPRRIHNALELLKRTEKRLELAEPQPPVSRHPSLPEGTPISLKAVIDISYNALDNKSRRSLRALSVFPPKPNSFSEEAALATSATSVEALDKLSDFGLLESGGQNRYSIHKTIVDYASLKRADKSVYRRLAEFFVQFIEINKKNHEALDTEITNINEVFKIAFEKDLSTLVVAGVNALYPFMESRGLFELAESYQMRTLKIAKALDDTPSVVTGLLNLGRIAINKGEYEKAEEYLKEGLVLARKIADNSSICSLLQNLGQTAKNRGNVEEAEDYLREGLTLARKLEDKAKTSAILTLLGVLVFNNGDYHEAANLYQEGLELAREIGDKARISALIINLGVIAQNRGNYDDAEKLYEEALKLAQEIGHRLRITVLLRNLSSIAISKGNYDKAEQRLNEGLVIARKMGHRLNICFLLSSLGWLAGKKKEHSKAEQFYQQGLVLARELGNKERIATILVGLGALGLGHDAYQLAEEYLSEGLALAREIKDRWVVSEALNQKGEYYLKLKELELANTVFAESLEVSSEVGNRINRAYALFGLARVSVEQKKLTDAVSLAEESLAILEALKHTHATEVKQWLDNLPRK